MIVYIQIYYYDNVKIFSNWESNITLESKHFIIIVGETFIKVT